MTQHDHKQTPPPQRNPGRAAPSRLAWVIPNATVFVSSGCIMAIELNAGRIIARHLGSSVYTWTSVIGIVLAGIALGNYLGGLLADRQSSPRTLAKMFMAASLAAILIALFDSLASDWSFLWTLSWPVRVALHVALVFFLPTAVLGMIGPVVAKMALDLGRPRGRTMGDIYSWGVVGSLFGTFLAGYYLIAALGTMGVVWAVGGTLGVMAILYWRRTWKTWAWTGVIASLAFCALADHTAAASLGRAMKLRRLVNSNVLYSTESQYSYIEVFQIKERPDVRGMYLDTLVHSQIEMANPAKFHYEYEKVYASIVLRMRRNAPRVDSLTIGGGGYVYPRYMDTRWPGSRTDVAEIDPAVTEAAMARFGLPRDTPINCFHEDGRVLVDRLLRRKQAGEPVGLYDFIFCDAVNDYNVPYQLTTIEFMRKVHGLIKPDGGYLMNMIDIYDSGLLLGSLISTMEEVFPYVYVLIEGLPIKGNEQSRNTFVIAGLNQPLDTDRLGEEYQPGGVAYSLTGAEIEVVRQKADRLVLTDDFCPVENLLAPVVTVAAQQFAVQEWWKRALSAWEENDPDRAADVLETALDRFPRNILLLTELGHTYLAINKNRRAMAAFEEAIDVAPRDDSALLGKADILLGRNRNDEALATYETLLRYHPQNMLGQFNIGVTLGKLGRFDEAIEHYKIAAQLDPAFANVHINWASALASSGKTDEAIEQYGQAIAIDENAAPGHLGLGNLYYGLGQFQPAASAFEKAIALKPDHVQAHLNLGNTYFRLGRPADAAGAYRRAVELDPADATAIFNLGNVNAALGNMAEAEACYRKALEIAPDDKDIQDRLNKAIEAQQ